MRERMGGAKNVKNAQWYELSVAAKLSSSAIKIGDGYLKITDFYFDPNHKSYSPEQTKAGYPAEIDITAIKANMQYNISCKFTEKPNRVLRPSSREFLEVLLEFAPIHNAEKRLNGQMNYILATNHIFGTELLQVRNWEFSKYEQLSERIKRFGERRFGNRFNCSIFQPDALRLLLNRLCMLTFSIDELEMLHKESSEFQKAYDILSRRLLNIPRQGLCLHEVITVDFTVLCRSKNHTECYDLLIEDRICHVGNLDAIRRKLERSLQKRKGELIKRISAAEIGFTPNDVASRYSISPNAVCRTLNVIFNKKELLKSRHAFYVLPVVFDILAFEAYDLAQRIKETKDEFERVHPLRVKEISALELDQKALEELTQLAYLSGFGYKLPSSDIIIDSDQHDSHT